MGLNERTYCVLLVSCSEAFNKATDDVLPASKYNTQTASSISEAKRMLADKAFDFVIINSPLPDESGAKFAIDCCTVRNTVVLIFARADVYSDIHDKVIRHGVFTLSKPTSKLYVLQALDWMAASRERLRKLEKKTFSVEERMEEIRVVNRAKCLLISELKMTEPEAHHYIEKRAMDSCIAKREVAEKIIKMYS